MARVIYDCLTVALRTTVGDQAIVGSLLGHTTKGVIAAITRSNATAGQGVQVGGATLSVAVSDGTNTRQASGMSENGSAIAATDTGRRTTSTKLFQVLATGSEAVLMEGALVSFDANGITVNVGTTDGGDYILWLFLVAGDVVQCTVGTLACSATNGGTATVSTLPARPRWLFAVGGVGGFATGAGTMRFSCGFAAFSDAGGVGQAGGCMCDADLPTVAIAGGQALRDDSILQRIVTSATTGALTDEGRYAITSVSDVGFTVTSTTASGVAIQMGYLAVHTGASRAFCADPGFDTSNVAIQTVTSGWRAQAALIMGSRLDLLDTNFSLGQPISFSLGGVGTDGVDGSVSYMAEDNSPGTSDTKSLTSGTMCSVMNFGGGLDWAVEFSASSPVGMDVDITNNSSTDRAKVMLLLEEDRKPVGMPGRRRIEGVARPARVTPGKGMPVGRRGGGVVVQPAAPVVPSAPARALARARQILTKSPAAAVGMGVVLRIMTRWRLDRLRRLRWVEPLEIFPPAPITEHEFGGETRGSNAVAGSEAGDNALAGSDRGS